MTTVKHVKARRTILLTGFGPFPGVAENATSKLVPALAAAAREAFAEHAFLSEILDTAWDSAPARVAALLAHHKPHLALHFGVAREAQGRGGKVGRDMNEARAASALPERLCGREAMVKNRVAQIGAGVVR